MLITMDSDPEIDPNDELLMHTYASLPKNCKKYWNKRYKLFSKFDQGVFLTAEMWYSVTPESTAILIARIVKKLVPDCENVLDVCCGGGGNTIQFARYFRNVGGVDINRNNIRCSQHNCQIYGVEENTWFVQGDWNELSKQETKNWVPEIVGVGSENGKSGFGNITEKFDFVFCSPPWGGPNYKTKDTFDLYTMEPFDLRSLCRSLAKFSDNYGLFLPRYLDMDQIREVTREMGLEKTRVVCLWQEGRPLGILAIFGPTYGVRITEQEPEEVEGPEGEYVE